MGNSRCAVDPCIGIARRTFSGVNWRFSDRARVRNASLNAVRGPVWAPSRTAKTGCLAQPDELPICLMIEKSGRYMAMTTTPTIAPITIIMSGSRIDVSALSFAATSSS